MAVMFPSQIPDEIRDDPRREAECLVYDELNNQLDENFHVYYSSPWLQMHPDGREVEGEADFIVAHPDLGILCLEVKGGGVSLDSDGQWRSTDRHKITYKIKNPVKQARDSKFALRNKLKKSSKWDPDKWVTDRHGVILPGVKRDSRDLRPDMPLELFAFNDDLPHLKSWIFSRFKQSDPDSMGRNDPLGRDGVAAIDDLIARPIRMKVPLSTYVGNDLKRIETLTIRQYNIIRSLERNPRMAISGAAGTGKTILALHKAQLLAESGKRVLLLCYNHPLSCYLNLKTAKTNNIIVNTFHGFYNQVIQSAEKFSFIVSDNSRLDMNLFIDAFIDSGFEEFDALIIDEGQDFEDEWLIALENIIKNCRSGTLYIYFDDNQSVIYRCKNYINEMQFPPFDLTQNFRNTKNIFNLSTRYYKGSHVVPIGPEGHVVEWNKYDGHDDLRDKLAQRIGSLIHNHNIETGQIAVLVPDKSWISIIAPRAQISKYLTVNADSLHDPRLVVESIRRFKGLERPVILLVLDVHSGDATELLYTAFTRAQTLLDIYAPQYLLKKLMHLESV